MGREVVVYWGVEDSGAFHRICFQCDEDSIIDEELRTKMFLISSGADFNVELEKIFDQVQKMLTHYGVDKVEFVEDPYVVGCPL